MQIIQSIREKGAAIIIVVIALSLIGFILMDAKQGSSTSFFGGSNDNVGKVNGEKITIAYFNKRVKDAEDAEAAQTGQQTNSASTNRIREQVWNQIVAEKVFFKETGKLGINLTAQEVSAVLMSNDPSNPFMREREMVDPATGKLDVTKAGQAYENIRKSKGEQREKVDAQILEPLKLNAAVAKYSGLLNASGYYPKWMKEKDMNDAKVFATISYVAVPYNEISDSAVTITDGDVNDYVKKHKDLFKQEAGRTISYATFSQDPSNADSTATRKMIGELRMPFMTDTNSKTFLARYTSNTEYNDVFLPKAKIPSAAIDTIIKQPVGSVYGPYTDGKNIVLAKFVGTKILPDSTRASHILIPTTDQSTGQALIADSTAKKRADSILTAVKAGADFGALALQYGSDGTRDKGGDLGFFGFSGPMVEEFNQGTFGKPIGTTEVIRTRFGYHVIKVTSEKGALPAYKIAFLSKEINASDVTINEASLAATRASAQKDRKALEAYIKPLGKALIQSPATIKENDFAIGNMQDARALVRWAFEAKKGAVSEPFSIGENFVVATVDNVYEEGTQDAATARRGAEAIIRNEKKSEMIIKKLGANPTLEAAAAAYKKQIAMAGADSSITMAAQLINGLGVEYKIIGSAFNKENQAKPSAPIAGTSAVYVMKTTSVQNKPELTADEKAKMEAAGLSKIKGQSGNWFEALRKQADIKDKRSKVF